jgi:hypothetical protein
MDVDLKKVRKTVDYLSNPHPEGSEEHAEHETQLVCVVNTTGTPFYQRQPLRDVVVWYGLSEGIRDGILKKWRAIFTALIFRATRRSISFVVEDFFSYGEVALPDGTPAKLAIFFLDR